MEQMITEMRKLTAEINDLLELAVKLYVEGNASKCDEILALSDKKLAEQTELSTKIALARLASTGGRNMRNLRDQLLSLDLNAAKLDELKKSIESKEMYKVYILYERLDWENSIEEERFVLYTEDESLANSYFNLLEEVEDAFASKI